MNYKLLFKIFLILILLASFVYLIYNKKYIYSSLLFVIFCITVWFLFFKNEEEIKEEFEFRFLDDDDYIRDRPEIYCGDSRAIPDEYDVFGTRYRCLKKGIGLGMTLSDHQRDEFLRRATGRPRDGVYCGNQAALPAGYVRRGRRFECFRKGVGVGLGMEQDKRRRMQDRPPRDLGKKEIMDLAKRFRITTNDKTRQQTLRAIRRRMRDG